MTRVYRAERNWGNEFLVNICPGHYTVKILEIFAGQKGGLQFHHFKAECGLILEGKLIVRTQTSEAKLNQTTFSAGDFFVFPPGLIHQEEAVELTYVLEISTPHFNDRVRLDLDSHNDNLLTSTLPYDVMHLNSKEDVERLLEFGFTPIEHHAIPRVIGVHLF